MPNRIVGLTCRRPSKNSVIGVITMIASARTRIDSPESVAVKFEQRLLELRGQDHAAEKAER